MSEGIFIASNGVKVEPVDAVGGNLYGLEVDSSHIHRKIGSRTTKALEEFFLVKRDKELGRWRDPEDPNFVVYRDKFHDDEEGRCILTVDERDGNMYHSWSKESIITPVAERYFDAHPEPKPWHDAKVGEVWVLTQGKDNETRPWIYKQEEYWLSSDGVWALVTDDEINAITAGRRIWPENGEG